MIHFLVKSVEDKPAHPILSIKNDIDGTTPNLDLHFDNLCPGSEDAVAESATTAESERATS